MYTDKFKEKVLKQALTTGELTNTARRYRIPLSTLNAWKRNSKMITKITNPELATSGPEYDALKKLIIQIVENKYKNANPFLTNLFRTVMDYENNNL